VGEHYAAFPTNFGPLGGRNWINFVSDRSSTDTPFCKLPRAFLLFLQPIRSRYLERLSDCLRIQNRQNNSLDYQLL
jgi:hypothetical protein